MTEKTEKRKMDITKLNELYDFKHGEMIEKVMKHPLLKKDKSEWNMKEMMDDGLVKSFKAVLFSHDAAFHGRVQVEAVFCVDGEEITLKNLFAVDDDNGNNDNNKESSMNRWYKQVLGGKGKFLSDIWVDNISAFTYADGLPPFRLEMEAKTRIPTGIENYELISYMSIMDADGNFVFGDMWVLQTDYLNIRYSSRGDGYYIVTRRFKHDSCPSLNILTDFKGKLLWKHWVKIDRYYGAYRTISDKYLKLKVKIPEKKGDMILDRRRFAYSYNSAEKLRKEVNNFTEANYKDSRESRKIFFDIDFYKNGKLLINSEELLSKFDKSEELTVL